MKKCFLFILLVTFSTNPACSWNSDEPDGGQPADGDGSDGGDQPGGRVLSPVTLHGAGGFFGISGTRVGQLTGASAGAFAIGAHYADISDGVGEAQPAGRLYFFERGTFPSDMNEAQLTLQPPDGALGGGFAWALGTACDFNNDTYLDFSVGNHLYTAPAAPNSGRVVVFWGDQSGTLAMDRFSYHNLSADLIRQSDSMGQTVLCADFNGDNYDDLFAGGQNAGASDTGLGAIFYGGPTGLPDHQDLVLEPKLLANKQYLGASSLYEDFDGDSNPDLAIGGWGLINGLTTNGPHTGGVLIFKGGQDWSLGPTWGLFPDVNDEIMMGVGMEFIETGQASLLAVGAPDYGNPISGAVYIYEVGVSGFEQLAPVNILVGPPEQEDAGFGNSIGYVPDYFDSGEGALLVGMKYGHAAPDNTFTGTVAVFKLAADRRSFEETPSFLNAPDPQSSDGFGSNIVSLGDVDGDNLSDFMVAIPEHLEGDIYTGTQTGGVIFFH